MELDSTIMELGCRPSTYNLALYFKYDDKDELQGCLGLHVSDIYHIRIDAFRQQVEVVKPILDKYSP